MTRPAAHHDDISLPKPALVGALLLIAMTIAAAAWQHGRASDTADRLGTTALEQRQLNFVDRDDGAVVVVDVARAATVATLAPGTNGFVRGVLRGLVRDRRSRDLGGDRPFVLTRWSDDHLTLTDDATGRRIELRAFGPTNEAAFRAMLAVAKPDGLRTAARE